MTAALRPVLLGAFALLTLSAACTQVLGIEDARIDSTLSSGAPSAKGGEGSAGARGLESGGTFGPGGAQNSAGGRTGDAAAGQGADSAAGAGPGDRPTLCETYCDALTSNCKGKYEQYRSFDQCIEVCKRLPPGGGGDENVNSVECRIRQARFAESEPFVYCKSAGPLGAGKCGSNCVSYCSLMEATCTAASTAGNVESSYFADNKGCLAACGALPADPAGPVQYSSSMTAEPSSFVGNNVFCRTYHVAAALEQDSPSEHCPHAMGGDPCIGP